MSLILNVPYDEKDQVKNLGAFWNPDLKSWTVPAHFKTINPFKNWIPVNLGCIVRKPYLLCVSKTNCWKCKKGIPMIALGARNYFYYDYADFNDQQNKDKIWFKGDSPTLFYYIKRMDKHVSEYLHQNYPWFKETYSKTVEQKYFGNTCTYCGALQGDFHHHCDVEGAFFPDPHSPVPAYIKLITLDLPYDYHIKAEVGGMSADDIFGITYDLKSF